MLKFHERDKASREQKLQVMHLSRTGTLPKNSSFSATLFLYLPASYRPKGPMCVWHVREKCLVPVSAPPDLQAFASACTWATSLCLESSDSWQTIRMKLRVCDNIDVRREMLPFHHVPHFSCFSTFILLAPAPQLIELLADAAVLGGAGAATATVEGQIECVLRELGYRN